MSAQIDPNATEDQNIPKIVQIDDEQVTEKNESENTPVDSGEPTKSKEGERVPVPGNSLSLPIARVKRIIKQDDDITACSTSAVYAIASATEMFVQYFTEQALLRARLEKRKRMHYNDFSEAVASIDQLQFLNTLIPKTEKFSDLTSRGQVKKHELSKGQKSLTDFAKTSTAKAKEQSLAGASEGETASPAISVTDNAITIEEMDIDLPDRPNLLESATEQDKETSRTTSAEATPHKRGTESAADEAEDVGDQPMTE